MEALVATTPLCDNFSLQWSVSTVLKTMTASKSAASAYDNVVTVTREERAKVAEGTLIAMPASRPPRDQSLTDFVGDEL
eukprot:13460996-Heterocapsa_arctica.AAC.2